MALEYILNIECPLQKGIKSVQFMRMRKIRSALNLLESRKEEFVKDGKNFDEVEVRLPYPIDFIDESNCSLTVAQLREAWIEIVEVAGQICPGCRVNIWGEDMLGCYGAINYPISRYAEEWLMARLNPPDKDQGYLPVHIRSNMCTGKEIDRKRSISNPGFESIFEGLSPVLKKIPPSSLELSSSQVFEFILGCQPEILPIALFEICIDFGILAGPANILTELRAIFCMEQITGLGEDMQKKKKNLLADFRFTLFLKEGDDRSVSDLKHFFYACCKALNENARFIIDG
jgi:hypothetical protein